MASFHLLFDNTILCGCPAAHLEGFIPQLHRDPTISNSFITTGLGLTATELSNSLHWSAPGPGASILVGHMYCNQGRIKEQDIIELACTCAELYGSRSGFQQIVVNTSISASLLRFLIFQVTGGCSCRASVLRYLSGPQRIIHRSRYSRLNPRIRNAREEYFADEINMSLDLYTDGMACASVFWPQGPFLS
ncbi:hypothetical protein P167DRAFT_547951 [Morchella conica CCBAS932]|uniref:Uncharacterized protein n=1 Tax=Morchella conica CCBAS932 TaxID=1392247 RepID=A0A3N4KGA1_9PEZI|nr:hypothetical protein P167DRAFT_547951 [Morchella conica CCBAS932]